MLKLSLYQEKNSPIPPKLRLLCVRLSLQFSTFIDFPLEPKELALNSVRS